MGLTSVLRQDPAAFALLAVLLLYSIIAHEVAHGWVASLYGDDTARRYGRLTANPLPHIDWVGLLMLFLVGFGWAKPVPVDYRRLRESGSRWAVAFVAMAGCLTNILIATLSVFLLQIHAVASVPVLFLSLSVVVHINVILGAFNLIPIPPLDGSKVLMEFMPEEARQSFRRLERYGFFILAICLYFGLLNPAIAFMERQIYGLISLITGIGR